MKLHHLIFAGLLAGFLVGMGLWSLPTPPAGLLFWLDLVGKTIFVGALKMIIAPLILFSIVAGVTSLGGASDLGRIGFRTLLYYGATTTIAVAIGLVAVLAIQPGRTAASLKLRSARAAQIDAEAAAFQKETGKSQTGDPAGFRAYLNKEKEGSLATGQGAKKWKRVARAEGRRPGEIFRDDILAPMLANPFRALSDRISLGIIFFSLLFGIACLATGEKARPLVDFFKAGNAVIMKLTGWLMQLSPFAIACLVAALVARHGPKVFQSLGYYCATVIGGIAIHLLVLLAIASFFCKVSPHALWNGIREAWLIAFGTRSSAATLPVTMRCVIENLKVPERVANFVLPLGATVNMDGTALYEGVAVIYLIQIYGGLADVPIVMSAMVTFLVFITAVLASVGAAAVPDAGLVTMVLVASAVGLPVYYIPLIFAVDAFLDMFRTSTNVLGDVVGCLVVSRLEETRP